ncbi:MAG: acyltransferase [Rhodospirillales bacterium]|jgi:virginiamycin A acetyltransferase
MIEIDPSAVVSLDARIHGSTRGTRIKIGAGTYIYDFVVIRAVGGNGDVEIGPGCHINPHCTLYSGNGIKMGAYVLLAPGVSVVPTNHATARRDIEIRHQGFAPSKGGVTIEDDVWIGSNAVILDGTHIGRGAVIAAGAVVAGEIPPYEVWGGTPARFIKARP